MRNQIKKIVFVVTPKVHLLDISGPAHVFYEAKEAGATLEIVFASFDNSEHMGSSSGLFFSNLTPINELNLGSNDFLFIPGSEDVLNIIKDNDYFLKLLLEWNEEGVNICSICIGVFWLAEAGLIAGKKSTTHWRYLHQLEKMYPDTLVQKNNLFVIENNLYMSAGVSSAIDLSLHILEQLYGYKLTLQISKEIVYYFRRAGGDPQLSNYLKYRNHIDTSVHKIQDYIMNNLSEKFTLDDIAEEVNMSKRNLSRKFKKEIQLTVGEYTNIIRAERANHLISIGTKIETVANECGFKSTNQLRTLLKKSVNYS